MEEPLVSLIEVNDDNREQILDIMCGGLGERRSYRADIAIARSIRTEVQPLPGPADEEAKRRAQEKRERKAARRRELR